MLRVLDFRQAEFVTQIDHGDYLAAKVDYASYMTGRLRHGRDVLNSNDFSHAQDLNGERLAPEVKCQVFSGALLGARGCPTHDRLSNDAVHNRLLFDC
jgi:hypothetical protein